MSRLCWSGQKSDAVEVERRVPKGTLNYRACKLGDDHVLAVLVRPVPAEGECIHCIETIR